MSAVVAVAGQSTLIVFDSAKPEKTLAQVRVRGMARNESLAGIDFQPSTGQLYGLGSTSRLYRIDPTTGRATAAGDAFAPPLSGNEFGFDFDPASDRIRVVSDADFNARLNPDTGTIEDANPAVAGTQNDLSLAYVTGDPAFSANPSVVASAYTRSTAGSSLTTLYGLDADTNMLVRQGSLDGTSDAANAGGLTTIGAVGIDFTTAAGFDITTLSGVDTAYAALATTGRSGLYTLNLSTGSAALVGEIRGSKTPVRDIAVVPRGRTVLVLDKKDRLHTFDSNLPNIPLSQQRISGLAKRESLLALDVRPENGVVYAFSNQNRIYTLNPFTGAVSAVGEPAGLTPRNSPTDIDFNPVFDRIRLVNAAGQNLRLNPLTGQAVDADTVLAGTQMDGPLIFSSTDLNANTRPTISGIAYNDNRLGVASSTVYAIDSKLDSLVTIGSAGGSTSPNGGQVITVGSLGVNVRDIAPMDIVSTATANRGYAVFRERSAFALYRIDLTTGLASTSGLLPKRVTPTGMTVLPAP